VQQYRQGDLLNRYHLVFFSSLATVDNSVVKV